MLFTIAAPTANFVSEYPEIVLWILGALFTAVTLFLSSWMSRHDKAREEMSAKLHETDKQLEALKQGHEYTREAIAEAKEAVNDIRRMVSEMYYNHKAKEGGS